MLDCSCSKVDDLKTPFENTLCEDCTVGDRRYYTVGESGDASCQTLSRSRCSKYLIVIGISLPDKSIMQSVVERSTKQLLTLMGLPESVHVLDIGGIMC